MRSWISGKRFREAWRLLFWTPCRVGLFHPARRDCKVNVVGHCAILLPSFGHLVINAPYRRPWFLPDLVLSPISIVV